MATMEKLMKAFESLKSFQQQQGPPTAEELVQRQKKEQATTKKDRVTHCLTICENIVAQSLRTSPEFQKLLGIAMEMFLLCSDDSESDVRMVADECLNKIIKALMDSNLPRLQLELYKEIKKNGASRSLRAALWRFAELAHLIRPQKCRPYLVNLLPCLARITKRQEETVQETLAAAMPKIMAALGHFANDGEIKVLLKSFVANLKSSSPTIRRTAASSAVSVCQHSRRASYFYTWLLNMLLGLLVPVDEEHLSHLILGVLLTLRYLMPLLQQQVNTTSLKGSFGVTRKEADVQPTPEQLLQVYELTLHYTQHWDHNVVTAALELLQQMFRTPPPELLHMLITAGSILHGTVFRQDIESRARSSSILELIAGGGSSCSPLLLRKQRGKMLSGEEDGLDDDAERTEVTTGVFTATVAAADGSSAAQVDIITEQPRSSQHTLQAGDSVDHSASSEQGGGGTSASDTPESPNDNEEEMLSRSSSGGANVTPETADYTTPETEGGPGEGATLLGTNDGSLPPSDSSQTTTEGPDSAVTPSDVAELSHTPLPQVTEPSPPSPTSTEGPDATDSDSSVYTASSSSSSSFSFSSSSSFYATSCSSSTSDKVLDGSESQYSGMQIGTLQDEEDEGAAPSSQEEPSGPILQSALALSKPHLFEGRGHNRQCSDSSVDRFVPKDEPAEPQPDNKPSRIKGPIGHYTDQGVEPLVHCVRLLAASFLLTGQKNGLTPDKEVRVSVKALAVSCVGAAAALHPEAFFNSLYLEPLDGIPVEEQQYISDMLGLIAHGDPQIRGATAILCAAIIQAALTKTRYNIHTWLASVQSATGNPLSLVDLVPLLQKTLKDESSVTCKMACSAVRHCLMTVCSSTLSELGLQLVINLLALRDSSYWLVRTELLETLAEMDFRLVNFLERKTETLHKGDHHYTGRLRLQERVLNDVVIRLLGDDDPRVRHVAASAVSRLVSRLFYDCDQGQGDPVVAIARDQSSVYLQLLMHETQPPSQFTVSTITRTYRGYNLSNNVSDVTVENNLSRVVTAVSHAFTSSSSRALTFGCCEALCLLALNFPVCTWSTGWHCGYVSSSSSFSSRSSLSRSRGRALSVSQPSGASASSSAPDNERRTLTVGMANMVLSLLSSAWFPLDLSSHQDALLLSGNLLAAVAPKCMRNPWAGEEEGTNPNPNKMEEPWAGLSERSLVAMVEQLFSHLLKILNICAHVLDDTPPGPAVKATLPSLSNTPSLSPIRRKGKEKDAAEPSAAPMSPKKSNEVNTGRPADSTTAINKSTTFGNFYHLPPYLKLYDVLKATHANFKVTLDLHSSQEKFGGFLRATLDVLSQLLELATLHDISKCVEEILGYLKSCFSREPTMATVCVQQVSSLLYVSGCRFYVSSQMHLDSPEALGVLNTLFETVAPSSLRPVDMLLKSMFTTPITMASVATVQLWVSGILAVLRVLVSQSTEDIVLSRVHELSLTPHLLSCHTIRRLHQQSLSPSDPPTADTLVDQEPVGEAQKAPPEETFARFLLQLVGVLLEDISSRQVKVDITEQQHTFYCQQLGTLLMCLIHVFKSGMFRRITAAATRLLKGEGGGGQTGAEAALFYPLEGLNSLVQCLITTHPSLVLLWCQVLLIIDYTNYSWWAEVHQTPRGHSLSCTKLLSPHSSGEGEEDTPEARLAMVNREIVRRGALILFCDYVCQNLHDSEHLTWLIVNHVRDLISLSHEPPVQDFISAVHRNSAASGLFIQAIHSRCDNLSTPTTLKKTLQCLEGIHLSQSGSLLMLYVDKLLSTPFRVLARMVDTLACRRVEMLLAETLQNSVAQLPVEELDRIQEYLQTSGLAQRHQRFYSLLDRFRATVAGTSSPTAPVTSHPLDGDPPPAPELVSADKEWYVALVKSQCCLRGDVSLLETTELLTKLLPTDLFDIMSCKEFNLSLLCPCLSMGMQRLARGQGSLLLETALQVTLERLAGVTGSLPVPHQSFLPPAQSQPYWNQLAAVYDEPGFYPRVLSLCRALSQYLLSVSQLPSSLHISSDKEHLITTFTCTAAEVVAWHLLQNQLPLSVDLQWALSCLCLALQQPCVWNKLSTLEYTTHTCSLIYCLHLIIVAVAVSPGDQLLHPEKKKTKAEREAEEDEVDSAHADHTCEWRVCEIMAELVEGLQSILSLGHHRNSAFPAFLTPTLRNIVISLSRLPLVNSYTRVPPLVWKLGWSPQPGGEYGTTLPEIPVDFLQEKDVFREFLYRINTLGWSSRTQFEETWATLLGVLVTQPITMDQEEEAQQEEDLERTQLNVLAVQAITSLVLSAMTLPTAGNPAVSCLEQQPRNKSLKALETRFGRKLAVIRGEVEREIQALVSKRDNVHTHHPYHAWDPVPSLSAASAGNTK
ncbi:huntingtin, partial [Anarrhichthys ocellatus]|uniref:huntingtin n=1 Tax=Anarrhichthys ocellatus TaxID=433405 RepID=UPI0012EECE3E